MWNLTLLYYFLIFAAIAIPLLIPGYLQMRKITSIEERRQKIIVPLKIVSIVLLTSIFFKQIANVSGNFDAGLLPFNFSDFTIFTLFGFAFSKPKTQFNKICYVAFIMFGFLMFWALLIAPKGVINYEDADKVFRHFNSIFTHYIMFWTYVWIAYTQVIKLQWKDVKLGLYIAIFLSITILGLAWIGKTEYNHCMWMPTQNVDEDPIYFWYPLFVWFPIVLLFLTGSIAANVLLNKQIMKRYWIDK